MKGASFKSKFTIILLVILTFGSSVNVLAASQFSDVKKGDSHYEGVYWLANKGITGYEDGKFRPHEPLSRQHAARMFVKALELPLPEAGEVEKHFDDVNAQHIYARELAAVAQAGIFTGDRKQFLPDNEMTREQMATTLVRAYKFELSDEKIPVNLKKVSQSHKESVQILANLELTTQLDDFRPRELITRGQFATFLSRSAKVEGPQKQYITKHYNYDFSTMLKNQMATTPLPQTDLYSTGPWYDASRSFTQFYLNPKNFKKDSEEYYQFLKLSGTSNLSIKQLNDKLLKGKGVLAGKGADFKKASKTYNVNEIYLISHALHETSNGNSELAKGIEVGENKKGKPVRVTKSNRKKLEKIKKTYNFFGIGAVDSCPETCGSEHAYSEGWFTPEKAIMGGAEFIGKNYISENQDTLYKMRWNPDNPGIHQYASDAGWALKQTGNVKRAFDIVKDVDEVTINFEIPTFNNQPEPKGKPTGASVFNVNKKHEHAGKTGVVNTSALNFRTGPTTKFDSIKTLPKGTKVTIIGENTKWYKVKVGKQEGWVSAGYIDVAGTKSAATPKVATFSHQSVTPEGEELLAKEASLDRIVGEVIVDNAKVKKEASEESVVIDDGLVKQTKIEIIKEANDWFKVLFDGKEGWMKSDSLSITNVMSVKANTEVKDKPNGNTIDTLPENETIIIIPDDQLELTEKGDWYKANHRGQEVWVNKSQVK